MVQVNRTVLIVDDFPPDREAFRRYLQADLEFSYHILEAETAARGLDLCQTEQIDGILLDFLLPDLNGLEFLESLQKIQANGHCPPVVMLTGQGNEAIAVKAIKSGAEDYLVKGQIQPDDVRQAVRNAVEKASLRQKLQESEERFRVSVENLIDCFGIYSAIRDNTEKVFDFRIDYLNPAAMASNRLTSADIGKSLCELFPIQYESGLFSEYCQVVETGKPLVKESLVYTDIFGREMLTKAYDIRVSKLADGIVMSWRDITDKKQTEIELLEREKRFRAIFNQTFQFIGLLNPDGIVLEVNQTSLDFAGITTADVVNKPFWRTKWWEASPENQQQLQQAIGCAASGAFVRYETKVHGIDHQEITIDFSLKPIFDENGEVVLIIPEARDISDREEILTQLQTSQNFIERIAETMPGVLYVYDLVEQRNVYINRQVMDVLGYTKDQIQAMGADVLPRLMHPDDFARNPAHFELVFSLEDGGVVEREYQMRHANGEWRWFSSRETIFNRQPDGTPSQVLGITQDITDSKHTQVELLSAIEKFELAATAVNCVIYDWDVNNNTVDRSQGLHRLLGYTPEQAGSTLEWWGEQIHPDDSQRLKQENLFERLTTQKRVRSEYRVRHQNGDYIWVEDRAIVVDSNNGRPTRIVGSTANISDRKRLELELRDRETLLNLAVESAQIGVWDMDLCTDQAVWSTRYKELLGLPFDWQEQNLTTFDEQLYPGDRQRLYQIKTEAIESGGKFVAEYRVVWPDGSIHWLADRGQVLYDEFGEAVRFIGLAEEITERKQAQEQINNLNQELQRRIDELQTIFEILPAGIAIADDPQYQQIRVNSFTHNIFQLPQNPHLSITLAEIQKLPHRVLQNGKEITVSELLLQIATRDGGEIRNVDIQIIHPDGVAFDLLLNTKPLYSENGNVRGCIAAFMNITERKQAELTLQREREKFDFVLNNAKASISRFLVFANRDWQYDYYSLGCEAIYGYTREELIGNKHLWISQVYPEDLENVIFPMYEEIFAEHTVSYDYRFYHKDGSLRWISDTLTSNFNPEQNAWIVTVIGVDITDKKYAEQERDKLLQEAQTAREEAIIANQNKDEFLAIVSHELRTPLNSIFGWTKILQTQQIDPEKSKKALETIERNVKSQSQLIEDLLDISLMIKGKLRLEIAPANLINVINTSIDIVSPTTLTKQIHLEFLPEEPTNQYIVHGDFSRLQQVVINLLTNALKFTPNQGQITIRLSKSLQPNNFATIEVKDTGKGIEPDFLPYVFERFRQASNISKRAKTGLGLGLAIVRNLVELHGGNVSASSSGKDQGATFTVQLPLIIKSNPSS